jgi:AraC-like DNA-binding protein
MAGQSLISVEDSHCRAGGVSVWHGQSETGLHIFPQVPSEEVVLFLPLSGTLEITMKHGKFISTGKTAIIGDSASFSQLDYHAGRQHIGIGVNRDFLTMQLSEMLEMPLNQMIRFESTFDLDTTSGIRLLSLAKTIYEGMRDSDPLSQSNLADSYLSQAMAALLLESMPHNYSNNLAARRDNILPGHIKRAIDFMRENIEKPLAVSEIAEASRVSVRSLQLNFNHFCGTSPLGYLMRLRLEKVRHDLLSKDSIGNVGDVARKWGFSHFGNFGATYRKAFGELPSETLLRSGGDRRQLSTTRRAIPDRRVAPVYPQGADSPAKASRRGTSD